MRDLLLGALTDGHTAARVVMLTAILIATACLTMGAVEEGKSRPV
jgi:hypothetical protein